MLALHPLALTVAVARARTGPQSARILGEAWRTRRVAGEAGVASASPHGLGPGYPPCLAPGPRPATRGGSALPLRELGRGSLARGLRQLPAQDLRDVFQLTQWNGK